MRLMALLLLFALPAEAGPLSWVKRHERFLAMEGTAIGSSAFEAAAVHHCRQRNGVEPCLAHYGEAWATFGVTAGMSTVVFPAITEGCWKGTNNSNWCYPLGYTFPAGQVVFSFRELSEERPHDASTLRAVNSNSGFRTVGQAIPSDSMRLRLWNREGFLREQSQARSDH